MSAEQDLTMRRAGRADLEEIVRLLAEDQLGATRERAVSPLPEEYVRAFEGIDADPNNELVVACQGGAAGRVVGCLQLTFIPYLTYAGSWRALVEGVRVDASVRSRGYGEAMMRWAVQRAGERGCRMVQLTSNKVRKDAIRFYERLGFKASHEGLKLDLGA